MRAFSTCSLTAIALLCSGCSIFFGTVKPVTEKSEQYRVLMLSENSPDWMKIETTAEAEKAADDQQTDLAFQSKKTASIISLNSACRPRTETDEKSLRDLTRLLLIGISGLEVDEERDFTLQSTPALQTTALGTINDEDMKLRTVVLRRNTCVYDFMYVARPDLFIQHEDDFSRFVTSFRIDQ